MNHFISFLLAVMVMGAPIAVLAHGESATFSGGEDAPLMMRYLEDQALSAEQHEEMEELMTKMMSGNLTQKEADDLASFMQEFPGPYGTMMGRHMLMQTDGGFTSMMPWHRGGYYGETGLLSSLTTIVWLIFGILGIILLSQRLNEKRKK